MILETLYAHPVEVSKCKTSFRLLREPAPAPWQMCLDEQAAFVAFFLQRETFLLNSANSLFSNGTLCKKGGKKEDGENMSGF